MSANTRAPSTIVTIALTGQTEFTIPFEYLARKYVEVTLLGIDRLPLTLNTDYRFVNKTLISLTRPYGAEYKQIELRRETSATERLVDFHDGSILRAYDLNLSQIQTLHVAEEARDVARITLGMDDNGNLDARNRRIVNLADAVLEQDAVPLGQVRGWDTSALVSAERAELAARLAEDTAGRIKMMYSVFATVEDAKLGFNADTKRIKISSTGFEYVKTSKVEALGFTDRDGTHWSRVEDLDSTITRRVTSTMHYSAWTQDKAFVHEGCIYVPYMQGVTHDTTTTSIMLIRSFDGGCTWSVPELLLKNTNALGYYSMNAGVIRGRFVMLVGEWPTSGADHTFYMYHKPLDRMSVLGDALSSTVGSTTITANIPKHGLFTGDTVFFTGVKNVSFPLSGSYVATVIDENTITIESATPATASGTGLGGASIKFSTLWDAQAFTRELAPKAVLGHAVDGTYPTHIHSTVTYDDKTLILGFHHGGTSPREAGVIVIDDFFSSRVWSKRRFPARFERHQQEPSIAQDSQGRIHALCRWSGSGTDMSTYAWTADKGVTWNCSFFKGLPEMYGTDWPMVIRDDVVYCFGAQRRPDETSPSDPKYYQRGFTDIHILEADVNELVVRGGDAFKSKVLSKAQYAGELSSSAVGVGSVIVLGDTLRYYYGSEDFCDAGVNANNGFSVFDPYKNSGSNADIWELQVNVGKLTSNVNAVDASGTKREERIFKRNGRYVNETPLSFEDASVTFQRGGQPVFQADDAVAGLKTMTMMNNRGTLQLINRPDNKPLSGGTTILRTIASGGDVTDWEMLGRRMLLNIPAVSGRVKVASDGSVTVPRSYGVSSVVRVEDGVFRVEFQALSTAHYCINVTPVTSGAESFFVTEQENRIDSVTFRFVSASGVKADPDGFTFTLLIGGA